MVGASELFTHRKRSRDKDAELFQQIGRLQMELEWLKKISAALTPMNCASWSVKTTLSSALDGSECC
jgi:hypothetical protein